MRPLEHGHSGSKSLTRGLAVHQRLCDVVSRFLRQVCVPTHEIMVRFNYTFKGQNADATSHESSGYRRRFRIIIDYYR